MAVLQRIRDFLFVPDAETVPEIVVPAPWTVYSIKPLTPRHLDEVMAVNHRCFKKGENYSRFTFNQIFANPNSLSYRTITEEGRMAGFIFMSSDGNGTGHITTLGVAPEHRRRGLAMKMIRHAEESLRSRDIRTVALEVRVGNLAAQNLYRRFGYNSLQRISRYYNNGEDAYMMVKSLV
jgi:ribosomal-protein-alanine acetyltransferase